MRPISSSRAVSIWHLAASITAPSATCNANIVVAEVVALHVADGAVIDAAKCHIDTARLLLIGRMQSPGGYTRTRDAFSMRQLDFDEWQSTRDNAATPNEP